MNIEEINKKRNKEIALVYLMINVYQKGHKKQQHIEKECDELKVYARLKIEKCPFMETKTFCSKCKIHCYSEEMRIKIKQVMRYSGPRMLLYHPIIALRHFIEEKRR